MNPIQKALWFVEAHSRTGISLDQVARASGLSPYHLTRAFAAAFGVPVMRYARRRRLSEAAKRLAAGASDILTVALDHGYNSHEAFSRAFKEEFGVTPEAVRASGLSPVLPLTEPLVMSATPLPNLNPPRIETLPPTRFVGLIERYDCQSPAGIPDQWQRFSPHLGTIPRRVGADAYGVCFNFSDDGRFDYLTGVAVERGAAVPFGLVQLDVPEQRYAVFAHGGHVAEIRAVLEAIWTKALPASGYEAASGPTLERFSPLFDPATGRGGFEVWVAVHTPPGSGRRPTGSSE